jgi:hypothetical protein
MDYDVSEQLTVSAFRAAIHTPTTLAHSATTQNNLHSRENIKSFTIFVIPILHLRWIFRKLERVVGIGWSWLRIGTGDGHLWVR